MINYIKTILIAFIIAITSYAQNEFSLTSTAVDQYLGFMPSNNNVLLLQRKIYFNKNNDSTFSKYSLGIHSIQDGLLISEIPLDSTIGYVYDVALSHDEKSFTLLSSNNIFSKSEDGFIQVQKYLLNEKQLAWQKQINTDAIGLKTAYSEDNRKIICVNTKSVITIDSNNGDVMKSSDSILSLIDYDIYFLKYNISKDGKYFCFWNRKYLTSSYYDEAGILLLADFLWYGLRWIIYLGSIPNYVYIWDINNNKLAEKFSIPYEANQGAISFSNDEKNIIIGPLKDELLEYSIIDKSILRKLIKPDSIEFNNNSKTAGKDVTIVTSQKDFIAFCYNGADILLMNYKTQEIIKQFDQTNTLTAPLTNYSMAFSPDNKFFGVLTKGNKINLYEISPWNLLWQTEISSNTN